MGRASLGGDEMNTDRMIGTSLALLSALLIAVAQRIPRMSFTRGPSAGFWPTVILTMMSICGIALALSADKGKQTHAPASSKGDLRTQKGALPLGSPGVCIILLLLYLASLQVLGFLLATVVFQVLYLYILRVRRAGPLLFTPVLVTIALFFFFTRVVYAPLPRGMGIFRTLSMLLYQ
ncbi:MAG TPA: tripartite tricarboxylate transporter TctB family protein [Firmicutes bacterium]|nr:tripartite tricarboxylate transporter TctB family protein [Bacillota bacterium]